MPSSIRFTLKQIRLWLPVTFCYGVILVLAVVNIQKPVVDLFPFYDKVIHFLEFTVFGVFLGSAVLREYDYQRLTTKTKIRLLVAVILLAGFGEIIQGFTEKRTTEFLDFIANFLGSCLGLACYFFEAGLYHARRGKATHYVKFAKYNFIKRVYFWLPPIIIFGVISFFSHQSPQDLYSKHLPQPQTVLPAIEGIDIWKDLLLLHLIQFGPLGVFLARAIAWESTWSALKTRRYIIVAGILLMLFLSWFDEWHQGQIPGRVNDVGDVLFNFAGGLLGMLVYWLGYRHIREKYFLKN